MLVHRDALGSVLYSEGTACGYTGLFEVVVNLVLVPNKYDLIRKAILRRQVNGAPNDFSRSMVAPHGVDCDAHGALSLFGLSLLDFDVNHFAGASTGTVVPAGRADMVVEALGTATGAGRQGRRGQLIVRTALAGTRI
jgi:hypothetical protein